MTRSANPVVESQQETPEAAPGEGVYDLSRSEVRRRSLAGVFYLTSSNVANLVIAFVGSLVLARLLTPADFGVVAIGATAIMVAGALADGGLGAGWCDAERRRHGRSCAPSTASSSH